MKKIFLICIICFLILIVVVRSQIIEVSIVEELKGKISSINYDNSSNIVKFSIEFYNTGSVPYKARIKTEIFNDNKLIFNGWSQEKDFLPGDKKIFDIYWYTNYTREYFVKLKAYFGNEIKGYKKFGFLVSDSIVPENVFEIKDLRTYENHIIFDVYSKEDAENIIIMPNNYVYGWIFEQKKIDEISKDDSKLVILNYYPTLWTPSNISLSIVSDSGRYYTEKTVEMKKNEGLTGLIFYIIDSMRIAFFHKT